VRDGKGVTDGKLANVDSIVVVRHGVLIYDRYFSYPHHLDFDPTVKHAGNSMTKSVVSLLVGIAIDHGLIKTLDAPVLSYFPEYGDLRTPEKDRITLRNLLTMSAGLEWHEFDISFNNDGNLIGMRKASDPSRYMLEQKVIASPGRTWNYNTGATAVIEAMLRKTTGQAFDELGRTWLFEPIGIDDAGKYGLRLRPRDWAKIGQLVLNQGAWAGKQIVSASWLDQSTTEQIKARAPFSYGFLWWLGRSSVGDHAVEWIAALGSLSQKIIIIPARHVRGIRCLLRVISAALAMSAPRPIYLRLRKDCGSAANRR
jgi:CubicO group peptidase (beta-lactamase class C family)